MKVRIDNILNYPYEDRMMVREWRNHPLITSKFIIPNIDEETHKNWLKSMEQKNPRNIAFFIIADNEKVGVNYFTSVDVNNLTAESGIFMNPDKIETHSGVALVSVYLTLNYIFDIVGIKYVNARVLENNKKVVNFNKGLGFRVIDKMCRGKGESNILSLRLSDHEWFRKRSYIGELVEDHL